MTDTTITPWQTFQQKDGESTRKFLTPLPREDIEVWRDDNDRVHTNVPHRFVVHSPDGFEYGYEGSGPADLALNILGALLPPPEAWRLHQDFKGTWIATIPRAVRFRQFPIERIVAWIKAKWDAEPETFL